MNRLGAAHSAYLRSAQDQPVHWREWGEEALAEAAVLGKPILLDIGAIWCHWCHVMDRESYQDPDTAALINELYVPVKVDRDERPDLDTRYQAAVSAISGHGGWPLTAFLTPDGKPYFGGTYFPPEERYGRPSFHHVLQSMAAAFGRQRAEVEESAASVMEAVEQGETFSEQGGELGEALLHRMLGSMLEQFDPRHGGFGSQPKFPHAGALDLLVDAASRPGPLAGKARQVVEVSLNRMAAGGIHDQLAGGFHRYSVDEQWVVPHFEKMSYDNSELLRVYLHAAQNFTDPQLAEVAARTVAWMEACLSDLAKGGFYASQDADESIEDDGDYFTWTRAEAEAVLSHDEFAVAERSFHLRAVGHMHSNPAKNVLHVIAEESAVATALRLPLNTVATRLKAAKEKLFQARLQRPKPFIDKTLYTGWNGLCVSAFLAAGQVLEAKAITAFALKSLDRVLAGVWEPGRGLSRVVAYADASMIPAPIAAVLDDYVYLGCACLDAWEHSGELRYFATAQHLTERLLEQFYDAAEGGFYDTAQSSTGRPLGVLAAKRKPLQDAPTPAGNSLAAVLLLRLHELTGSARYREAAEKTLALFAGVVEHLGLYAASYGQALRRLISTPVQVCILGQDELAEALAATAHSQYLVTKSVVRLRREQLFALPPALAATLPFLRDEGSMALVCTRGVCMPPVRDPGALEALLSRYA